MERDHTPKPVENIPDRLEIKVQDESLILYRISNPTEEQISFLEKYTKALPFFILKYGDDVCIYLDKVIANPVLSAILSYTAKGIGWLAKKYSVN